MSTVALRSSSGWSDPVWSAGALAGALAVRAKRPLPLPVVLTRDAVRAVLQRLDGVPRLIALVLYGAGVRLLECSRLRVKDIDVATNQVVIRDGKGHTDRVTRLPAAGKAISDIRSGYPAAPRGLSRDAGRGACARWWEFTRSLSASGSSAVIDRTTQSDNAVQVISSSAYKRYCKLPCRQGGMGRGVRRGWRSRIERLF